MNDGFGWLKSVGDLFDIAKFERLEEDNKPSSTFTQKIVASVEEKQDGPSEPIGPSEDLYEDELEAINAIRQAKGRAPWSGTKPGTSQKKVQCRYCKKWGHFQKDCKSRLRDNAPMVGEDGKPYQPRQPFGGQRKPTNFAVKAIVDDNEPDIVGYVSSIRTPVEPSQQPPLNW